MDLSKNEKVQQFLDQLKVVDIERFEMIMEVRKIIFQTFPDTAEKIMYGGITFFSNDEMYSGLFVYKNHISIEFSNGYLMNDPKHHLEGSGKYRRHLKLKQENDILEKSVKYYVKQASGN